jgi:HSP20 family protein
MNYPSTYRRVFPLLGKPFSSVFDNLFDDPFFAQSHLPEAIEKTPWVPVNISENEKAFSVALEIPGMDEKDIQVQVMGNQLVVSGDKKWSSEKKEKDWHRVECQYGSFQRSITLPPNLRADNVEAVYKKGVLTLTIPKVEPTPATKVKVRSE